ncbi:hypothetical protein K469DRAFT_313606 [Zopfia rhizophila CBS 207.26]|uniref:F-box domain-containing protein n=1 Tax=Zopfia rhizophila CBS 207.26 TaxID=1314779 RepID=A0A6A6ELU5_9PEZI|nr:hypothetical protein K469DRAFT_313606 [Zopfia rhizophila CBS 207.26]
MARSLLNCPPELLINILAFLPIQALLKFSQTCRYSHALASSSLHTLSLGIYPTRVAGIISRLGATHYPQPKEIRSAFSSLELPSPTSNSTWSSTEVDYLAEPEALIEDDPYKVSVLIPEAQEYDYMTLLAFHTALTKSVLVRHCNVRHLDLSLWTLSTPIAKALSGLPALRALSLRIEGFPHVRAVPRSRGAAQRGEQRAAWELLANEAVWAPRLSALRIEGGELSTKQLTVLMSKSRWCREIWLCKCNMIGKYVWSFLGSEWEGRAALRILGIIRCGGQLDEEVLDIIGKLDGLQVSRPSFVIDRPKVGLLTSGSS